MVFGNHSKKQQISKKIALLYALMGIQLQDSAVEWRFVSPSSDEGTYEDDYIYSDPKQQPVEPTDVPRRRHNATWEIR